MMEPTHYVAGNVFLAVREGSPEGSRAECVAALSDAGFRCVSAADFEKAYPAHVMQRPGEIWVRPARGAMGGVEVMCLVAIAGR